MARFDFAEDQLLYPLTDVLIVVTNDDSKPLVIVGIEFEPDVFAFQCQGNPSRLVRQRRAAKDRDEAHGE